jgi:hypothetical protein
MTTNRRGFSDCEADEKSRLEEGLHRGMGSKALRMVETCHLVGDGDWITLLLQLALAGFAGACTELDRTSFEPYNEVS